MSYQDLRDFMAQLEATGELRRVHEPVSPHLEMTALSDRVLRASGPALLFTQPTGHHMPVLTNLFGTPARVARAMGVPDLHGVRALGELLATLKEPEAPKGFKDMLGMGQLLKTLWNMAPHTVGRNAPCQQEVWEGPDVDLARLPVQHCWPGDVAPLITWGLTITRGPRKARQNLGIYRQQVLSRNQVIVRWLAHRCGAAEMSCIAGVGGDVPHLMKTARSGRPIIALDGCPLVCVKSTLARHGIEPARHYQLQQYGVKKRAHEDFVPAQAALVLERVLDDLHYEPLTGAPTPAQPRRETAHG